MVKITDLKKIKTYKDLDKLKIGKVYCNISYRGGNLGFLGKDVAKYFKIKEYQLSTYYGCGCNYLGGGLRGSIFKSGFSKEIPGRTARLLDELAEACIRVYKYCENKSGIEDDAINTGIGRVNVRSAY